MTPRSALRRPALALVASGSVLVGALVASPTFATTDPDAPTDVLVVSQTTGGTFGGPDALSLATVDTTGAHTYAPVQLPSTGDDAFTMGGVSNAGGFPSTAADGSGVTLGGFRVAADDTSSTDPKGDPTVRRAVGFVDDTGAFTSYDLADPAGNTAGVNTSMAGGIRTVATPDGKTFYAAGNDNASGVVVVDAAHDGAPVALGTKAAKSSNFRTVNIVDGRLYVTSDKTSPIGLYTLGGATLPDATATAPLTLTKVIDTSGLSASGKTGLTPNGFVLLDTDGTAGPDLAYLLVEGLGIEKYALVSGTWTDEGTIAPPLPVSGGNQEESLAGRQLSDGHVELYTVDTVGNANHVVRYVDTAAASAAPSVGSGPTTVATAPSGTIFHGVTIAPTAWNPPAGDGGGGGGGTTGPALTVTPSVDGLPLAIGDDANPTSVHVDVTDGDGKAVDDATVAASVVGTSGVVSTGAVTADPDGGYDVAITPGTVVGRATVSVTADADGFSQGKGTIPVGLSGDATDLPGVTYLAGAADASTAIDVGDGYDLVADDEDNTLRLYDTTTSGAPVKTWSFDADAGLGAEADLEAATRVGDTIYWFGSFSDTKSSVPDPARDVVFTTTVSGSGSTTQLTYGGKYTGLRHDLVSWAAGRSDAVSQAIAADCQTGATQNYPDEADGCNLEGVEMAPGSTTTAYLALRAPVVGGKAVLVPVTNLPSLIGAPASSATFGAPFTLDLGGRGVREIRKNADDQYLVTAGAPDVSQSGDEVTDPSITPNFRLFRWDGKTDSTPTAVADLPSESGATGQEAGSWETILSVPTDLDAGGTARLAADNGTTVFYGGGTAGKDLPQGLQKDVTLSVPVARTKVSVGRPSIGGSPVVGQTLSVTPGDVDPTDATSTYTWSSASGDTTADTYTVRPGDVGSPITVTQHATSGDLTGTATSDATDDVTKASFSTGVTASITGELKVGQTVTASAGSVAPTPDSYGYQWYADGVKIGGAVDQQLLLTDDERGSAISVEVTARRAGYVDSSDTSDASAKVASAAAPTVTFGSSKSSLREGQSTTLTWTTHDADDVTASGAWSGSKGPSGTQDVTPTATGTSTYVLTATNDAGSTSTQVAVPVTLPPTTLSVLAATKVVTGHHLSVKASGLAVHEPYTVWLGGIKVRVGRADDDGTVATTITAPTMAQGVHTLKVSGSVSDRTGSRSIKVYRLTPLTVKLVHASVKVSAKQRVTVGHLVPGESVVVTYRGKRLSPAGATAGAAGTYTLTFGVGTHVGSVTIRATGGFDGRHTSRTFHVVR